jgi:N-acetyl-gamma-glutamyl-phosphate reductase
MVSTVFIDGEAGTTGLRIRGFLESRTDLTLLSATPDRRRDPEVRRALLNEADAVILCLPDDAAREAVSMVVNPAVRILDASTAHRVAPAWVYGFPEMSRGQRDRISSTKRVSNPGCYPTGFIALIRPLVEAGIVPSDWPITVNAVSGYSGGGKSMIAEFEDERCAEYTTTAYRPYAMNLTHKHVPEMQRYSGLSHRPLFAPAVGRFHSGMIVETPLPLDRLPKAPSIDDLRSALATAYRDEPFVRVASGLDTADRSTLDPEALNGGNEMELHIFGSDDGRQARLVAILDNLGKGAAGAAVQNLNLMLNLPEHAGLSHEGLTASV